MGSCDPAASRASPSKGVQAMKVRRGEIWLVDLDPIRPSELGKTRPCLIISDNAYNDRSSVPLVMPITSYPPGASSVRIFANSMTGLSNDSSVLPLHIRPAARSRFKRRLGRAPASIIEKAIAILDLIVHK